MKTGYPAVGQTTTKTNISIISCVLFAIAATAFSGCSQKNEGGGNSNTSRVNAGTSSETVSLWDIRRDFRDVIKKNEGDSLKKLEGKEYVLRDVTVNMRQTDDKGTLFIVIEPTFWNWYTHTLQPGTPSFEFFLSVPPEKQGKFLNADFGKALGSIRVKYGGFVFLPQGIVSHYFEFENFVGDIFVTQPPPGIEWAVEGLDGIDLDKLPAGKHFILRRLDMTKKVERNHETWLLLPNDVAIRTSYIYPSKPVADLGVVFEGKIDGMFSFKAEQEIEN